MKKFFLILIMYLQNVFACQCPVIQWTKEIADKNEVITRVIIKNIIPHQNDFTVAEAEVVNLFKGNPFTHYKILFPENDGCAVPVSVGEEWIIYGKQKQINSCEIHWCGLSRKKFQNDAEDFFIATHIITYDEELNKIKQHFPEIKIETATQPTFHKNIIPEKYEFYLYLALSITGFLIILYIVKNYFK